jgi:hypothetical protein
MLQKYILLIPYHSYFTDKETEIRRLDNLPALPQTK